jgi:hypothetical protein
MQKLNLRQEADHLEDLARRNRPAALAALNAILDRVKRLDGQERDQAMNFNARLIGELRQRGVKLYTVYYPPENPNGQPLPVA